MVVATVVLAGLGSIAGLGLGLAARYLAVETDPRQEKIAEILPGANCGGCGFAGCIDFAAALAEGRAKPEGCPVGGRETAIQIASILGNELGRQVEKVALVFCQGSMDVAPRKYRYNGFASCRSEHLLEGGEKVCAYGCLGLGDCLKACAFRAIEITDGQVGRVLPGRCTGCGRCVEECPRDLIHLVPKSSMIHVLCSNRDKGAAARKACGAACIGCKKCERFLGDGSIRVEDFLARVDYDNPPANPEVIEQCPTDALRMVDLAGTARCTEKDHEVQRRRAS